MTQFMVGVPPGEGDERPLSSTGGRPAAIAALADLAERSGAQRIARAVRAPLVSDHELQRLCGRLDRHLRDCRDGFDRSDLELARRHEAIEQCVLAIQRLLAARALGVDEEREYLEQTLELERTKRAAWPTSASASASTAGSFGSLHLRPRSSN